MTRNHTSLLAVTCAAVLAEAGATERPAPEPPPLSPDASQRLCQVRDGFVLERVAEEPLVIDPVAVDWGPDGKIWVAEMADYPYGIDGKGKAGGRVVYLLDTDGDVRADVRKVFLEGVSFPTGVMAWDNGVIVTAAPEIFYAEDRDGDGAADFQETWFSGFIEGNQQLRVNGLRWGLDNWIYCASGGHHAGFGVKTVITSHKTGKKIPLGSRDFRFRPDGRFEPESGPSQFGRVRDDWGNWFGVQNALPLWHYVLPDRYMRRNPDVPAPDARRQLRDAMPRLFPAKKPQKRFHGFDHVGRYTSACGISIYRDDLLFPRGTGETIGFTCAPFHNVVQRHVATPDGASFSARRADDGEIDFFASADRWCRPVMSRTAPDGSLWIVDFYRYMIEHPQWLPQAGKDELKPHYREGDNRGRLYRIYPEGRQPRAFPNLRAMKGPQLIATLEHPNGQVLDLVLKELAGRRLDSPEIRVSLADRLTGGKTPRTRIYALAALDGTGLLQEEHVATALTDPDPRVRKHALRLAEPYPGLAEEVIRLKDDPSPAVRQQLAFSLGSFSDAGAGSTLTDLAIAHGSDAWFEAAVISSAPLHFDALATECLAPGSAASEKLVHDLLLMSRSRPQWEERILSQLVTETPTARELRLLGLWLDLHAAAAKHLGPSFAAARTLSENEKRDTDFRVAAIGLLAREPASQQEDIRRLAVFLDAQTPAALRDAAIGSLVRTGQTPAFHTLIEGWIAHTPRVRAAILEATLSRPRWVALLLDKIESGAVAARDIDAAHRQRLLESKDKKNKSRAGKVFAVVSGSSREDALKQFQPALQLAGDTERGKTVFAARCAICHKLGDTGNAVGPDLNTVTDRSRAGLLTAIIDPNRSIEPKFLGYTAVLTEASSVLYGMVSAETGNSLIFRLPDGSEKAVLRSAISRIESSGRSFMPEGLEAEMENQEMADLLEYVGSATAKE